MNTFLPNLKNSHANKTQNHKALRNSYIVVWQKSHSESAARSLSGSKRLADEESLFPHRRFFLPGSDRRQHHRMTPLFKLSQATVIAEISRLIEEIAELNAG